MQYQYGGGYSFQQQAMSVPNAKYKTMLCRHFEGRGVGESIGSDEIVLGGGEVPVRARAVGVEVDERYVS